ncbi:T9SS type A sorting domain-containing protein [Flavobacterium sp. LaA7.5]|nr:T9SS type A sorting domain-containing protein [Flavobacterium salilacus subsp. altitudinum]
MKKHLLFFLLLITAVSSAQIVNIPDENFKNKLLEASTENDIAKDINNINLTIDINEDGEIQISEAEAVYSLHTDDAGITSLTGLEAFTNLKVFWVRGNPLTSIDVSFLANLEELNVNGSYYGDNSILTTLNLSGLNNLKTVVAAHNHLTSLDVTGLQNLEVLSCEDNIELNLFTFGGNNNLRVLNFRECGLSTLNLSELTSLEYLEVSEMALTNLNIEGCLSLEELYCSETLIQSLDISNCAALELVECVGDENALLESVIIGELPNLISFRCNADGLTELDFSGCPNLEGVNIYNANELYINMKNGSTQGLSLINSTDDVSIFFCVDEDEELTFPIYYLENPNYHFSSYCSFTPGGNYNTITGNFTFDGDNNGCDTGDNFGNIVRVNINDGTESGSTFSNNNGNYNFYTEAGTFTLTPNIENSDWFTISPTSATVTFADDNNNTETQNFCITPNGEHPDVEVVIVPIVPAQPGFNATYKIIYRNKGNQTLSGSVSLSYNDAVLDYVSSTSGVTTSGNVFAWNYNNLQPFETRNINLTLNVNSPMEDPAVNIDDLLVFTANVTPITGDETPENNNFTLAQTVVGSYDPNDITCLEGEAVNMIHIGEYLHYNINFENTGTAPATFIVVKNEINQEQFDINTLQLMDASHNVETRITGNTVEFYFGDINLAANGGKGNVLYKIKTLSTLLPEDTVTQQANIFFDYNFPIETNEANTTFATLSNTVFTKDSTVKLYPNPTTGNVTITADTIVKSVELYDIQGRLLQVNTINNTQATLNLTEKPSGLYFVKVITDNGAKVEKIVKE